MSNTGSDSARVAATTSTRHGTPSSNRSEPTSADSGHIRMGRGLVKVKRYEKEASRGSNWSPTSPTSPASVASPTSPVPPTPTSSPLEGQERAFRRRWFQPPFMRRRNVSFGAVSSGGDDLLASVKRGEIKSWVSRQPHHGMWAPTSRDDLDVRPTSPFVYIRGYESDRESARTPTIRSAPSRPALSIGPYSDASSSICTGDSFDTTASSQRAPPLQNLSPRSEEDTHEDGRILFEALGLQNPTPVPEQADSLDQGQPQSNNLSDPMLGPDEFTPQLPCNLAPVRPLPPIPSSSPSSSVQPQGERAVPQPSHSQDAYTYVFGYSPRSSQHRASNGPPPPYASRYSTILDRPGVASEDLMELERHLHGMALPQVAPLDIRKRDDKTVQRDVIIENSRDA
ncbi:hypothetical protein FRC06_003177 [Ceratobasidium sp. 370]|nr:hypothetical protein FRC06_003177 [Ceratobasidium sp. 370]